MLCPVCSTLKVLNISSASYATVSRFDVCTNLESAFSPWKASWMAPFSLAYTWIPTTVAKN